MLRPGNAGSNTATDHISVTRKAMAQLPGHQPPGRKVLIRVDAAGATHAFLDWLTKRRLSYSIGFTLGDISDVLAKIPDHVWTPAYTSEVRSVTAPGSPSLPDCWTCPTGRKGCGSSRGRNGPIPVRSSA
jgi:hypothetical protein